MRQLNFRDPESQQTLRQGIEELRRAAGGVGGEALRGARSSLKQR